MGAHFLVACLWAGWGLAGLGGALLGMTPHCGLGPGLLHESCFMLGPVGLLGPVLPLVVAEQT